MDHGAILRRSLGITWRHKGLWVLGFLMAITGGSAGLNVSFGGGSQGAGGAAGAGTPAPGAPMPQWPAFPDDPRLAGLRPFFLTLERELRAIDWEQAWPLIAAGAGLLCCAFLLLAAIGLVGRYVARVGLIRSVDAIEGGEAPGWRAALGLGWSERTFRLFLLDLVVGLFAFMAILFVGLLVVGGLVLGAMLGPLVVPAALLLLLVAVPLLLVAAVAWSLLGELWSRELVLADRDVGGAVVAAFDRLRARPWDLVLMWVLMVLAGLAAGFLVFLPLLLFSGLLAAGAGLAVVYLVYQTLGTALGALLAALPVLMLALGLPLAIAGGVYAVFQSGVWTLTWRAVALPGTPTTAPPPAATGPGG